MESQIEEVRGLHRGIGERLARFGIRFPRCTRPFATRRFYTELEKVREASQADLRAQATCWLQRGTTAG